MHRYRVFQGMENGVHIGQGAEVTSQGPAHAMKFLFGNRKYVKVSQREVFGSNYRSLQYNVGINNYRPNFDWIQLNELDTGKSYFFRRVA